MDNVSGNGTDTDERFTLRAGRWYAWMMLPGYNGPYVSPIYVMGVEPEKTGGHTLCLSFHNAYYAAGIRDFRGVCCRVLKRFANYMLVDLTVGSSGSERSAVISDISKEWLHLAGAADKYEWSGELQNVLTRTHFRGHPPAE